MTTSAIRLKLNIYNRSKCAHILPCVFKLRAKEAEEIQLYQMQEKEKRKMAELERENMWHEVAMKESEALVNITSMTSSGNGVFTSSHGRL